MFSNLYTITLICIVILVGVASYLLQILFAKIGWNFLSANDDYCDNCGAKLFKSSLTSSYRGNYSRSCPRCGFDCKHTGDL